MNIKKFLQKRWQKAGLFERMMIVFLFLLIPTLLIWQETPLLVLGLWIANKRDMMSHGWGRGIDRVDYWVYHSESFMFWFPKVVVLSAQISFLCLGFIGVFKHFIKSRAGKASFALFAFFIFYFNIITFIQIGFNRVGFGQGSFVDKKTTGEGISIPHNYQSGSSWGSALKENMEYLLDIEKLEHDSVLSRKTYGILEGEYSGAYGQTSLMLKKIAIRQGLEKEGASEDFIEASISQVLENVGRAYGNRNGSFAIYDIMRLYKEAPNEEIRENMWEILKNYPIIQGDKKEADDQSSPWSKWVEFVGKLSKDEEASEQSRSRASEFIQQILAEREKNE